MKAFFFKIQNSKGPGNLIYKSHQFSQSQMVMLLIKSQRNILVGDMQEEKTRGELPHFGHRFPLLIRKREASKQGTAFSDNHSSCNTPLPLMLPFNNFFGTNSRNNFLVKGTRAKSHLCVTMWLWPKKVHGIELLRNYRFFFFNSLFLIRKESQKLRSIKNKIYYSPK